MSKILESSQYMYEQFLDMSRSAAALEKAAERITMHNIQLRAFLLRLVDPEDLGHAVTNEVRDLANKLVTMEHKDGSA